MKILGVDYGSKRVGLAISDELGMLARELEVVDSKKCLERIKELLERETISKVVVGLPLGMGGQDTQKTTEVRKFVEFLAGKIAVPVETFDERMTTQMARSIPGGQKDVDSLAAQMILQMYLDSLRNTN